MNSLIAKITGLSLIAKIILGLVILLAVIIPIVLLSGKDKTASPPEDVKVKPTLAPFPTEGAYIPDQLIIQYQDEMGPEELSDVNRRQFVEQILKEAGVISQEKLYSSNDPTLKNYYVLKFAKGINLREAAEKIYSLPEVKNAETNAESKIFN